MAQAAGWENNRNNNNQVNYMCWQHEFFSNAPFPQIHCCSVLYCYGAFTPCFSRLCLYGPVYDGVIGQDRSGETKLFSSLLQRYLAWKLLPKLLNLEWILLSVSMMSSGCAALSPALRL